MHKAFMLRRPKQTYIVRALIEYVDATCAITPHVTAVDLGSLLTLAIESLLFNVHDKDLGGVGIFRISDSQQNRRSDYPTSHRKQLHFGVCIRRPDYVA